MWFGQGNDANWDDDDNKMLDGCKDLRNGYISDQGQRITYVEARVSELANFTYIITHNKR